MLTAHSLTDFKEMAKQQLQSNVFDIDPAKYGFHDDVKSVYETERIERWA